MKFSFIDSNAEQTATGIRLIPATHGVMTLTHGFALLDMRKLRYCPSRCLGGESWGQLAVGFKAGADCIITEKDGTYYAKSERGSNTYPLNHEAQVESEFQPVLSCWRGSRKGCVDCARACPEIDPVKARRESLMSPVVVASQRARKKVERYLLTNEIGLSISGECLSQKVSSLMRILGAKGGRVKSEKKRLAAKRNILIRWATKR